MCIRLRGPVNPQTVCGFDQHKSDFEATDGARAPSKTAEDLIITSVKVTFEHRRY